MARQSTTRRTAGSGGQTICIADHHPWPPTRHNRVVRQNPAIPSHSLPGGGGRQPTRRSALPYTRPQHTVTASRKFRLFQILRVGLEPRGQCHDHDTPQIRLISRSQRVSPVESVGLAAPLASLRYPALTAQATCGGQSPDAPVDEHATGIRAILVPVAHSLAPEDRLPNAIPDRWNVGSSVPGSSVGIRRPQKRASTCQKAQHEMNGRNCSRGQISAPDRGAEARDGQTNLLSLAHFPQRLFTCLSTGIKSPRRSRSIRRPAEPIGIHAVHWINRTGLVLKRPPLEGLLHSLHAARFDPNCLNLIES